MGRVKGEMGERYHRTSVVSTIDSGIEVGNGIVLLMVSLVKKGTNNGSIFQN